MPERLAERLEEALRDPRLLSLRDDIALVNIEITEALAKLDNEEPDPKGRQVIWNDINDAVETRRKLVHTESRHLAQSQQMFTGDQVLTLVGALMEAIKEHVTDRATLSALSRAMASVVLRDQSQLGAWEAFIFPESDEGET